MLFTSAKRHQSPGSESSADRDPVISFTQHGHQLLHMCKTCHPFKGKFKFILISAVPDTVSVPGNHIYIQVISPYQNISILKLDTGFNSILFFFKASKTAMFCVCSTCVLTMKISLELDSTYVIWF